MIALKEYFPQLTPEEYFAWEEQQLERHEYIEGKVYAMIGGTINHGNIAGNFLTLLKTRLRGSGCREHLSYAISINTDSKKGNKKGK